jgi:hypothetical protein
MKQYVLILAVAAVLVADLFLMGCVETTGPGPVDTGRVLKTTHAIYLDVRTVVTDPEVMPMFAPAELQRLAELERQYLEVAERMEAYPNDAEAIEKVSYLAGEILGITNEVAFVGKARPYIAAIRISIQILRNHL